MEVQESPVDGRGDGFVKNGEKITQNGCKGHSPCRRYVLVEIWGKHLLGHYLDNI